MAKRKKKEQELNPDKIARELLDGLGLYTEIRHFEGRRYRFQAVGHGNRRAKDPLIVYGAITAAQPEKDEIHDAWRLRLHVGQVDLGLGTVLWSFVLAPKVDPVEWGARACCVYRPQETTDELIVGRLTLY